MESINGDFWAMNHRKILVEIKSLGWPYLFAALFAIASYCEVVATASTKSETGGVIAKTAELEGKLSAKVTGTPPENAISQTLSTAVSISDYEKDVALVFEVAKIHSIALGPVDYKSEPITGIPFLIRTIDLRVDGDYPKIKDFCAKLLKAIPNAAIQELRIERKDTLSTASTTTLKIALLYSTGDTQ